MNIINEIKYLKHEKSKQEKINNYIKDLDNLIKKELSNFIGHPFNDILIHAIKISLLNAIRFFINDNYFFDYNIIQENDDFIDIDIIINDVPIFNVRLSIRGSHNIDISYILYKNDNIEIFI